MRQNNKKEISWLRWLTGLAGIVLAVDCILRILFQPVNLGSVLIGGIAGLCLGYSIFAPALHKACSRPWGKVLFGLVALGAAVMLGLLGFISIAAYNHPVQGNEQVLIVLGAGTEGDAPGDLLRRRLEKALEYQASHPDSLIVVTGGQARYEQAPQAQIMARWLTERGVPEENILVEDKSASTEENLLFAVQLLQQNEVTLDTPAVVVTNGFHCYRAGEYAELAGLEAVRLLPASISVMDALPCYLREVLAVLYYWVFTSSQSGWMASFVGYL